VKIDETAAANLASEDLASPEVRKREAQRIAALECGPEAQGAPVILILLFQLNRMKRDQLQEYAQSFRSKNRSGTLFKHSAIYLAFPD
jgi:hypothetical protein